MTSLERIEKDIMEMKASLAEIKKVLGIGTTPPCNIIDIRRRAIVDAEALKRKTKYPKDMP
jgi:hypothetical protein